MQLFEVRGTLPRYSYVLMPPNARTAAEEMNQLWFCWGGVGEGEQRARWNAFGGEGGGLQDRERE